MSNPLIPQLYIEPLYLINSIAQIFLCQWRLHALCSLALTVPFLIFHDLGSVVQLEMASSLRKDWSQQQVDFRQLQCNLGSLHHLRLKVF